MKQMKQMKPKKWTPLQEYRLPEPGYLLQYVNDDVSNYSIICIKNGYVKYSRSLVMDNLWHTLLWSCCPTKKQISESDKNGSIMRYEWFSSYTEFITTHPEIRVQVAPNDF